MAKVRNNSRKRSKVKKLQKRMVPKKKTAGGSAERTRPPKKQGRIKTRGVIARRRQLAEEVLPGIAGANGCGAYLVVAERAGEQWDEVCNACEVVSTSASTTRPRRTKKGKKGGKSGSAKRMSEATCQAFAAVGNQNRATLMRKLLDGPATYKSLQRAAKLAPGPLYHHINQLRLAGLILPKQRDLYELTRGGRNLILVALVIGAALKDSRRRPVAK